MDELSEGDMLVVARVRRFFLAQPFNRAARRCAFCVHATQNSYWRLPRPRPRIRLNATGVIPM